MDSAITALKKDDRAGFAKNMVEILPAPTSTLRHELYPWPNSSIVVQYIPTFGLALPSLERPT